MSNDSKRCRIFISHASADAYELIPIVDLLTDIYELEKEEITFTSLPETTLANFSSFNENLRKAIQESNLIIIYLTNTYIKREYCLYELGAIWGLNKNCFLINRGGINNEKLPDLLLGHTYSALDDTCIDTLVDSLDELHFNRRVKRTADYNSRKKRALEQINAAIATLPQLPEIDSINLKDKTWEQVNSNTENIERSAGFRKVEQIYVTKGPYPKFYIMQASPRVFNWEGEDHFDETAKKHYCILEQSSEKAHCQRINIFDETEEDQKTLSLLYKKAKESANKRIKLDTLIEDIKSDSLLYDKIG